MDIWNPPSGRMENTMKREPGMLVARDAYVLEKMARGRPPLTQEWQALLDRKLASARLPECGTVPPGLAMIDARVTFHCASGLTDTRTLCLPGTYVPGGAFLPITTFYGLALLGLREGESIAFARPEGRRDWLVLDRVHFQPSADDAAPEQRPAFRLVSGGLEDRSFVPANENGPGEGPGPSAA
jgi:regulator of nucleoside diphosphate kinase